MAVKQGRLRVLIVDDQPDVADSMAMLVRLWGHDAVVAYDGDEAVRAAREHRPDFVFSDLMMPGLDGYRLAGLLRREDATRYAVLVAVSADAEESVVREAGFDALVLKTASLDVFRAVLERGGTPVE